VAETAKLFENGRSQAVRLPKQFRMAGKEVNIRKEGEEVILSPIKKKFDFKAWRKRLDDLGARDFLPEGRPEQPPMPPDRVIFEE
jgi:antitoxin VapB